jgi:hypothetical protein
LKLLYAWDCRLDFIIATWLGVLDWLAPDRPGDP